MVGMATILPSLLVVCATAPSATLESQPGMYLSASSFISSAKRPYCSTVEPACTPNTSGPSPPAIEVCSFFW